MLCFSNSAAAKQRMLNWFVPDVKMNRTYVQCIQTGYDLHPSPIKLLRKKGCWAKTAWGGKSVNSAISANCFPKVSKQEVAEHKTEWNLGKMCVFWQFGAKDRQFYTLLTQHCQRRCIWKHDMMKRKFFSELELEMSKWSAEGVIFISGQERPLSIRTFLTYILLRPFCEKFLLIAVKLHFKIFQGKISIAFNSHCSLQVVPFSRLWKESR